MTEPMPYVAVAKPVVAEECTATSSLPMDDAPVVTVALPLMLVLVTFVVLLIIALAEQGDGRDHTSTLAKSSNQQ